MKKVIGDYRYIAGSAGKGSLWAGPDHLLYVEASGILLAFKERYRRIDYKNIQALTFGRTQSGRWIAVVLMVVISLLVWGVVANFETERGAAIFFATVGAPLLLILIVHLAKGPTCVCKLQTAVQVLRLKPLGRMRRAAACVEKISELCDRHQGAIPEVNNLGPAVPVLPGGVRVAGVSAKPAFQGSALVTWSLVTMLITSILSFMDLFVDSIALYLTASSLTLIGGVLVVAGLARSMMRYRVPGALLTALFGEAATIALAMVAGYALFFYVTISQAEKGKFNPGIFGGANMMVDFIRYLSKATFQSDPIVAWTNASLAALGGCFALLGLPKALRPLSQSAAQETPISPSTVPPPSIPAPLPPLSSYLDMERASANAGKGTSWAPANAERQNEGTADPIDTPSQQPSPEDL